MGDFPGASNFSTFKGFTNPAPKQPKQPTSGKIPTIKSIGPKRLIKNSLKRSSK